MRWKRDSLAATTVVASEFASISAISYGTSVSKPAVALASQISQAEKQKPI